MRIVAFLLQSNVDDNELSFSVVCFSLLSFPGKMLHKQGRAKQSRRQKILYQRWDSNQQIKMTKVGRSRELGTHAHARTRAHARTIITGERSTGCKKMREKKKQITQHATKKQTKCFWTSGWRLTASKCRRLLHFDVVQLFATFLTAFATAGANPKAEKKRRRHKARKTPSKSAGLKNKKRDKRWTHFVAET